jgi:carbamoyl-phosphate synthase small subunit
LALPAFLVLADGTRFEGEGIGAEAIASGELVFNTAMTGYAESLTDPSYNGQVLMPTYPLIGNYSFDKAWAQSARPWVEGYVVSEACVRPSHRAGSKTLDDYLRENGIPGIQGIDTRALTRKLRNFGVMDCVISNGKDVDFTAFRPAGNLVAECSTDKPFEVNAAGSDTVVVIDCGAKQNIVDSLARRGFRVVVVPWDSPAEKILSYEPAGLVVSNGPGDPTDAKPAIQTVRELYPQLPTLGICLGHQILALAAGGQTYKLKFGHRGANHGVRMDGRVVMTSQNHGYAVAPESLKDFFVSAVNLNDNTVEGMRSVRAPAFSVQFHPEASPGPHDSAGVFDEFKRMTGVAAVAKGL